MMSPGGTTLLVLVLQFGEMCYFERHSAKFTLLSYTGVTGFSLGALHTQHIATQHTGGSQHVTRVHLSITLHKIPFNSANILLMIKYTQILCNGRA